MNAAAVGAELDRLLSTSGARLVLAASASDGLVLTCTGDDPHDADAVAALFAAMFQRARAVTTAHGRGEPRMLSVRAGAEQVLVTGAGDLVLVVVAGRGANVGRIRLELLRAAEIVR